MVVEGLLVGGAHRGHVQQSGGQRCWRYAARGEVLELQAAEVFFAVGGTGCGGGGSASTSVSLTHRCMSSRSAEIRCCELVVVGGVMWSGSSLASSSSSSRVSGAWSGVGRLWWGCAVGSAVVTMSMVWVIQRAYS